MACHSQVVQKMASLMQEWGSSGLATAEAAVGWERTPSQGQGVLPVLCLKPQMAIPNRQVLAHLSVSQTCLYPCRAKEKA